MSDQRHIDNVHAMLNGWPVPHPEIEERHHTPWGPMLAAGMFGYMMAGQQQRQQHPPPRSIPTPPKRWLPMHDVHNGRKVFWDRTPGPGEGNYLVWDGEQYVHADRVVPTRPSQQAATPQNVKRSGFWNSVEGEQLKSVLRLFRRPVGE